MEFPNRMAKFRHKIRNDPERLKRYLEKEREKKLAMTEEDLNERRRKNRERLRIYRNKKKRVLSDNVTDEFQTNSIESQNSVKIEASDYDSNNN